MSRQAQPLLVLALGLGSLLLILVTGGPLTTGRGRPTDLHPAPIDEPPAVAAAAVEVHDLASLTPADAARLDGKRCRRRVTMAGPPDRQGDRDVYEVLPLNDPQGILYLPAGPEAKGVLPVDAMLKVIHHPRLVVGPVDVASYVEYRLVDAVRAAP